MIFSYARAPFLEFLRNLTPQVMLFSIAIVLGSKLDLSIFDFGNTWNTIPFLVVMATFFAAAIANMFMFMEGACRSFSDIDAESKRLHGEGITGARHLKALGLMLFRKSKILFAELLLVMAIIQVGFLVVFIASIQAATNLFIAMHGGQTV